MKRLPLTFVRAANQWSAARTAGLRTRLQPWVQAARMKLRLPLPVLWREIRQALHTLRQRLPKPVKRLIRRIGKITIGTVAWAVAAILGLFIAAHVWLPTVAEKKPEIEQYLTGIVGNPVELGELETFWDGLNPGLRVRNLRILTVAGEPALRLRTAQLSLSWRALLLGTVEIRNLTLVGPQLTVERLHTGQLRVTGLSAQMPPTTDALPDFSVWLLRQREIVIVDGELQWLDRGAPAGRNMVEHMAVHSVQASIYNDGQRHAFHLRAEFPEGVCTNCQVSGVFEGNPLRDEGWSAEIHAQGQRLDLQALPGVIRRHLPAGLTGRLGMVLTGRWNDAQLAELRGRLRVQDFSVPAGPSGDALALRELDTGVHWQRVEPAHWRLRLESLRLAHAGAAWQAGQVELDVRADEGRLSVDHLNLSEAAAFLAGWSRVEALRPWLREAEPGGWLHQLRASWSGSWLAPDAYRIEARADGLRIKPSGRIPGVDGLAGRFVLTPEQGEFRIDSHGGRLALPQIMHESVIPFARLAGRVRWQREVGAWRVEAGDIDFRNADARVDGTVELHIPDDRRLSPVMNLAMQLHEGRGESAGRYFPRVTPEALRGYLIGAIRGGRVTHAKVILQGALAQFPYRQGEGVFEVRARVRNGSFAFLPDWEPLRNLDVDMRFTGRGMLLTADTASLRGLHVSRVAVEIEDFFAPKGVVLAVRGHASGAVADAVTVLRASKAPPFRSWLLPEMTVSGQGVLDLDLQIPLNSRPELGVEGEYRISGGRLLLAPGQAPVEAIQGMMGFDQNGLRRGQLAARWLGNALELKVLPLPAPRGGAEISLRGAIAENVLPEILGPALSRQVQGRVPWQLQWRTAPGNNGLALAADLREVEIILPAPLAKRRGEALVLEARSAGPADDVMLVALRAGHRLAGKLVWQQQDGRWNLRRGRIALGEPTAPEPAQDGMHLSARLPEFNVDRWWPILQPAWELSGAGSAALPVNHVTLDIAALHFLDRGFGRLRLDLVRGPGYWSGRLEGEAASGQGLMTLPGPDGANARAGLQLSLTHLTVPPAASGTRPGSFDPRKLPALELRSDSFRYAQYSLGALDFRAEPAFSGWRITAFRLKRPEATLKASGQWAINRLGIQSCRFDVQASSDDLGRTLGEFGHGEELVGGTLTLRSSWQWPGAPGDFALAMLNGDASVEVKDGRLPRISPGAGRLFGAFDLRSLTRILTLDFSTVFAKGLTFDKLHGRLEVESGNAYTRGLEVQVPGADIELRGRIGLADRDLDLHMDVTPRVSTNLAPVIGGTILGGPVVGGAIAVISGVTRKPFEKTTRTEYRVKGSWSDPQVDPVRKPATVQDESAP